jgi:hypothetical protein
VPSRFLVSNPNDSALDDRVLFMGASGTPVLSFVQHIAPHASVLVDVALIPQIPTHFCGSVLVSANDPFSATLEAGPTHC